MKKQILIASLLMLIGTVATAQASTVNVTKTDGTLQYTSAVSQFTANGATMAGMQVTAYFSDETSETAIWQATGATSGAATGSRLPWSLSNAGNTFNTNWVLSYQSAEAPSIVRIFVDGGTVTENDTNAVAFDMFYDWDIEGTENSAYGGNAHYPSSDPGNAPGVYSDAQYDFYAPGSSYSLDVTYSGIIALDGQDPVGDLYRYMNIDFVEGSMRPGGSLAFFIDTDNVVGTFNPVPLPSALVLFGTGMAGLLGLRRKKQG